MLKNANKVLESSVDSLRSNQQEKLAPLLEQIALLEEEKRIMAEEMHTKIHCREQTISNLEESLKQATRSRLDKNKKNSALKLSEQLLARATRAAKD
jgi:DNA-binding protein H-NS